MHVDGMTGRPRHIPLVRVDPSGTERREGGPHTDVLDVKTTVVTATRGYQYHFTLLGGPEFLNDFTEKGQGWEHVHRLPCQSLIDRASIASAWGSGTGDINWGTACGGL